LRILWIGQMASSSCQRTVDDFDRGFDGSKDVIGGLGPSERFGIGVVCWSMNEVMYCALGRFFCSGNVWSRIGAKPEKLVTSHRALWVPRS
jgi:hypothetical protein